MQAKFWCLTIYTRNATRKPLLILIYVHIIRVIGLFNCTSSRTLGNKDRICNDKDPNDGVSDSNMLCGEFSVIWNLHIQTKNITSQKRDIIYLDRISLSSLIPCCRDHIISYHCPPYFLLAETKVLSSSGKAAEWQGFRFGVESAQFFLKNRYLFCSKNKYHFWQTKKEGYFLHNFCSEYEFSTYIYLVEWAKIL